MLGTAVGDSLGLPREGLSGRRAGRLFPGALRHRLVLGRGMISDDTEHTCFVAQALLASPTDPDAFGRSLGWRLRGWLLGLPAGIGFGTLRALFKLWLGFPPHRSGVFSAGNGPAMRAPILGACLGDTPLLREVVRVSTRVTHTDPKAEEGALAVALAAHHGETRGADLDAGAFLDLLRAELKGEELRAALDQIGEHLARGAEPSEFAEAIGQAKGISGYVNHTVPAVLFCWLRSPTDYRAALTELIELGGDADTTGAILGGVAGATVGSEGIPAEWIEGICEWPRTVPWLRRLGGRLYDTLEEGKSPGPLGLFWPGIPLRNLLFLSVVLTHGFRRLLPPY
ncbi:MAG: ADP-ribosylglycohydrolase family protein [Planctomycetes bacterium]|nr:ADP-ribosylglycohydrolase family protein [Planctomycetota bacterium]